MDNILSIAIAIATIVSSVLAIHPNNHYSIQTKILKVAPRLFLSLQFLIAPFLVNNIYILATNGEIYNLAVEVRVTLWGILMFFLAEIAIQWLNIKFGRAETREG